MRRRPRFTIARIMGLVAFCGVVSALARLASSAAAMVVFGVPIVGVFMTCLAFRPQQPVSSVASEVATGGFLGGVAGTFLGVVGIYAATVVVRNGDGVINVLGLNRIGGICFGFYLGAAVGSLFRLVQSLVQRRTGDRG